MVSISISIHLSRARARARLPKLSNQTCDLTAATCPTGIDTRYVHRMSTEGHINCKGQQTCAMRDAENARQVHLSRPRCYSESYRAIIKRWSCCTRSRLWEFSSAALVRKNVGAGSVSIFSGSGLHPLSAQY